MPKKGEKQSPATIRRIRRSLTTYNSSYCGDIIEWFVNPVDKSGKWNNEVLVRRMTDTGSVDALMPVYIPTLRDFADFIGVSIQTIYNWVDTYDEFADAYIEAMEAKQDLIYKYTIAGVINPNFAKYMLESWKPRQRKVDKPEKEKTEDQAEETAKENSGEGYHIKITVETPPDFDAMLNAEEETDAGT